MHLEPFHLERYFARHEFSARYLLSSSDCEALSLAEVLALADEECRRLWEGLRLGYTESPGLPLLRRAVADLYEGVAPDEVLEVVPEEGILLAMVTLLEPGDHVIATWPGYQTLYGIARQMGCDVTYWQPDEAAGWRFDVDDVRRALRPTTRLVVVNLPHNPTGALLDREAFDELVGLVEDAKATLFSDEMYRWLERDPGQRLPAAVERSRRAVTLCGLSKSFSLPGLRVGWLVTHDRETARRLAVAKDYTTICGSAPGEVLAVVALRHAEAIAARNRERVAANVERFNAFVERHKPFRHDVLPADRADGPQPLAAIRERRNPSECVLRDAPDRDARLAGDLDDGRFQCDRVRPKAEDRRARHRAHAEDDALADAEVVDAVRQLAQQERIERRRHAAADEQPAADDRLRRLRQLDEAPEVLGVRDDTAEARQARSDADEVYAAQPRSEPHKIGQQPLGHPFAQVPQLDHRHDSMVDAGPARSLLKRGQRRGLRLQRDVCETHDLIGGLGRHRPQEPEGRSDAGFAHPSDVGETGVADRSAASVEHRARDLRRPAGDLGDADDLPAAERIGHAPRIALDGRKIDDYPRIAAHDTSRPASPAASVRRSRQVSPLSSQT